jgi:hypothetical protein
MKTVFHYNFRPVFPTFTSIITQEIEVKMYEENTPLKFLTTLALASQVKYKKN